MVDLMAETKGGKVCWKVVAMADKMVDQMVL